uniref:Capsid protein n=1 Tax=Uromyces fabae virus TaxID=3069272 RepID=A0AA51YGZ9_9VIRU|nr:putative capsid protein [Uromyces fabae virus]
MHMQLYRFWKKNKSYDHTVTIPYSMVESLLDDQPNIAIRKFREYVQTANDGVGLGAGDVEIRETVKTVLEWAEGVKDIIERATGDNTKQQIYNSSKYEWNIKIWKMYKYDDGHSKSGDRFGEVFGFIHNKFKKPMKMFNYQTNERQCIVAFDPHENINDGAADNYGKSRYFINVTSLTKKEVSILSKILNGNIRQTPFLADQNLALVEGLDNVVSLGPVRYVGGEFQYGEKDIHQLLIKLINTHRWHEDYLAATRAARYWVAQPGTETVEAHWWLHQERRLILPKLGLRRACFHFLIQDEGVCTTQQAIDSVSKLHLANDAPVVESGLLNTFWYWGEFLSVHNKKTQSMLQRAINGMQYTNIDERYRADVMVSAMIGKKVDLAVHSCIRTEWAVQLEEKFSAIVPFGRLNFNSIADYGYRLVNNNYILNTLVTPGCTAVIIGLSGTLIAGTPYSSIFKQRPAMKILEDNRNKTAYTYNDLWAYGVYCRWQGYDLAYNYPMSDNRHVTFAANNVGIAMPPVKPNFRRTLAYTVEGVSCRQHQWGTEPNFLSRCEVTYAWRKTPLTVQRDPEWNAIASSAFEDAGQTVTSFKGYADQSERYVAALVGTYDINSSGFQIAMINPAVVLDPGTGQSPLPGETEMPEDLIANDAPLGDT